MAVLLAVPLVACHKEEQAVVGVAKNAVNAEQQAQVAAQARATTGDQQREALSHIPLPTKSLYVDVHDPSAWANPFLAVGPDCHHICALCRRMPTPAMSAKGRCCVRKPRGGRRSRFVPSDLAEAMVAVPQGAWQYGRVVAVAELPGASAKDRPKIRRNVEAAIQQLNDLGIVVEEWPTR